MPLDPSYAHEIAQGVAAGRDRGSVFAFMEGRATDLGSSLISVGQLRQDGPSGVSILCPRGPQGYFRHYVSRRYDQVSPVVARMRSKLVPFMWSEVHVDRSANPLGYRCMSEAREAGLVDALCVPIGTDAGTLGGWVTFFTDRVDGFDARSKAALHFIALMGHHQLTGFDRFPPVATGVLTASEREVLTGVYAGQNTEAISALLGISTRTVEHHIFAASIKLGTSSRLQTALEAARTGQL